MTTDELLAEIENVGSYNDMLEMPLTFIMLKRLARIVRAADEILRAYEDWLDPHRDSYPGKAIENYRKARDGDEV